jgi:hypothetical protein
VRIIHCLDPDNCHCGAITVADGDNSHKRNNAIRSINLRFLLGSLSPFRGRPFLSHNRFLDRLKQVRVLDPACGSGNFLYLAILALKNLEHKVNLDAEAFGLGRQFPAIGPE